MQLIFMQQVQKERDELQEWYKYVYKYLNFNWGDINRVKFVKIN